MVRKLSLTLAVLASGCASLPKLPPLYHTVPPRTAAREPVRTPPPAPAPTNIVQAHIAEGVTLILPTPPNYPETRTIVQTGRARFADHQGAFDSVLTLSPERVEIVLAMAGGPRLATIDWDANGVRAERAVYAPSSVPVENILADIFMAAWPPEIVSAALPEGLSLTVGEGGARTIRRGDETIIEIASDPANAARTVVRNSALGYEVSLITLSQE